MKNQQRTIEKQEPEPDPKRNSLDGFKLFFEEVPLDLNVKGSPKRIHRRSRARA